MSSEKNLHHFGFWHPPLFNFYIDILLPGTKEIFLPDGLKRFLLQLASPLTSGCIYVKGSSRSISMTKLLPKHAPNRWGYIEPGPHALVEFDTPATNVYD